MRSGYGKIALLVLAVVVCLAPAAPAEQVSYEHLARAIELFEAGRYDEAFEETSKQVEINRFCALAYYYRARIRVIRKQYGLAEASLKAAFRDSSGFTDAVGLHAYVLEKMGRRREALAEWKRFLDALGAEEAGPAASTVSAARRHVRSCPIRPRPGGNRRGPPSPCRWWNTWR